MSVLVRAVSLWKLKTLRAASDEHYRRRLAKVPELDNVTPKETS
jgi:hypothetical protein